MELEILELIYDYSINWKLVDQRFIDKLIEIIVTRKSLDNYVSGVTFTNELINGIGVAAYNFLTQKILINYQSLQTLMRDESKYDCLFNVFLERTMYKNLTITQIILHELEHAYQNKQTDNKSSNSIEVKLVKACLVLEQVLKNPKFQSTFLNDKIFSQDFLAYAQFRRKLYEQYYVLNPTERLAQINSFRTIVDTIKPIEEYIPSLYEFNTSSLVENLLRGYQESWLDGFCPTQVYLVGTGQSKTWSGLDFYSQDYIQLFKNVCDQYSLNERLSLGLPINYEEYRETDDSLRSTNRFKI